MNEFDGGKALREIEEELTAFVIHNLKNYKAKEMQDGIQWGEWQEKQLKYLENLKKQNQERISEKFQGFENKIENSLRNAYELGRSAQETEILQAVNKGFKGMNRTGSGEKRELDRVHGGKLEFLIRQIKDSFHRIERSMLKRAEDEYRKVIMNAPIYADKEKGTYETILDSAAKDFLSSGINCIEYKNGARVNASFYASMALETAKKRAFFQGEGAERQEWGISTVIVKRRGAGCPKCVRFSGCVAIDDVWSGGKASDGEYPLLSSFIAEGLYHPNCKDGHSTYFEGVSEPQNPLTEKEIKERVEVYQLQQEQKNYERMACKYTRLAEGSLDGTNRIRYAAKVSEWKQKNLDFIKKNLGVLGEIWPSEGLLDKGKNDIIELEAYPINNKGMDKISQSGDYDFVGPLPLKSTKDFTPYTKNMLKYVQKQNDGYEIYLESLYIKIRMKGLDDIETVARNSGLSEYEAVALKKHVFLDVHDKVSFEGQDYAPVYFSADADLACMWMTAQDGELTNIQKKWFRKMANHELNEKILMDLGWPLRHIDTFDPITKNAADDPTRSAHFAAPKQPRENFPGLISDPRFSMNHELESLEGLGE